ncbi:nucleotide sugar dehydrogenase [Listeria booriae]|uniref:nucleotide sugar dehydrogenase n=1 Tax=Listeria booriae TaxID=1552123 RepID=UPI0016231990|nr:nucleotide sugar dehydrogenase [Listeria booriae]MBC1576046.1 nucleotide sugar dehydrogenase [Listeria booriae]MBC2057994.1 nucleotide sugar dehydrogenase [Listeria booriae]MBC2069386.1 nucleotide sugar dehydrogenase [Listeria booriae]MBC2106582.1 nucleotide sugar dehydrogenase [Listeria booriae]
MKVITLGLGYIGLPTSLMFARHGVEVVGVDISEETIKQINMGSIPIEEPGLTEYLHYARRMGNFKASLTPETGDVFIIAVPTPNLEDSFKGCDLSFVKQGLEAVLPYVRRGNIIIIESTISPRTMTDMVKPLFEKAGFSVGETIFLVHCPERVLPGNILNELIENNRIIGGVTDKCTEKGKDVYRLFVKGKLLGTDASTAELAKLMENTYRDVNIALANELVQISTQLGIDALEVVRLANQHPRVNIHNPGPGVGGHCLAVDPYFIVAKAPEQAKLISLSRKINNNMPHFIVKKIIEIVKEKQGSTITILGLAYKGNTDDVRESPSIKIVNQLCNLTDFEIKTFDPHVHPSIPTTQTMEEALLNSDLAVILCDHKEFENLSDKSVHLMKQRNVFDTKNILLNSECFDNHYNLGSLR